MTETTKTAVTVAMEGAPRQAGEAEAHQPVILPQTGMAHHQATEEVRHQEGALREEDQGVHPEEEAPAVHQGEVQAGHPVEEQEVLQEGIRSKRAFSH